MLFRSVKFTNGIKVAAAVIMAFLILISTVVVSNRVPVFAPPSGRPIHTVALDLVEGHRDGDE